MYKKARGWNRPWAKSKGKKKAIMLAFSKQQNTRHKLATGVKTNFSEFGVIYKAQLVYLQIKKEKPMS